VKSEQFSRFGGLLPEGQGHNLGMTVLHVPHSHPTELIYEMVLETQLPHETVNVLFQLVIETNKLTMLWGG
jgi:hypothetical protein